MNDWKFFKIDTWWKAILILGILSTIGAATIQIPFIERKHLFGLGLGLICIGISYWMALKYVSSMHLGGILSTKVIRHDFISIIILIIGLVLTALFGYLIVKKLI